MADALIQAAVVLEMIFINYRTVCLCCMPRGSRKRIGAAGILFTLLLVGVSMPLLMRAPSYGNGNGLFVLIGFLYLIPMRRMFADPFPRIFVVLCTAWIYTMFLFSVSVHLAYLFPKAYFFSAALAAQTLLALALTPFFWKFVRERFVPMLKIISAKSEKYLRYASLMWFATAIVVNLSFVYDRTPQLRLVALLCLAANALLSFILLQIVVQSSQSIDTLERVVFTDHLTGLSNRGCLFQELDRRLKREEAFTFLYLDLDRFKSVNDELGHLAGDAYLVAFAQRFQQIARGRGSVYRMSGDEFVCLCGQEQSQELLRRLKAGPWTGFTPSFLGVSVGWAHYPQEGKTLDALIARADGRMYAGKRKERS